MVASKSLAIWFKVKIKYDYNFLTIARALEVFDKLVSTKSKLTMWVMCLA